MKSSFRCFFTEKLFHLLPILLVVPAMIVSVAAFFPEAASGEISPVESSVRQNRSGDLPASPQSPKSGDNNGSLQLAIPGGTVPVVVSRRNFDPLTLREFHGGNNGMIYTETAPFFAYIQSKKCEKIAKSTFQDFLQRSLPPRAGPKFV